MSEHNDVMAFLHKTCRSKDWHIAGHSRNVGVYSNRWHKWMGRKSKSFKGTCVASYYTINDKGWIVYKNYHNVIRTTDGKLVRCHGREYSHRTE